MLLRHFLTLSAAIGLALVAMPTAKADLLFVGSQAGFCCFNVQLHSVSATDVNVNVTLTGGATAFVNTGNSNHNHPGFAFNLAGAPITIANIVNPQNLDTFFVGPVVTNGPNFGTFDYIFTNLDSGGSAHNAGPLTFDIVRASGVALTDFTANAAGYYFEADILNGTTGESGISAAPTTVGSVPEPASIFLLGAVALGLIGSRRYRLTR